MTDDLRERLTTTTDELVLPPDLLQRVRAGGRRRLLRRRGGTALVGVLVVAAVGIATTASVPSSGFDEARPTLGQLANDQRTVDEARQVWDASHATSQNRMRGIFDDLRGEPRVVWVGTTPGGVAAVVAQDAVLREHEDLARQDEGRRTLYGFLGDDGTGRLRLVGDDYAPKGVQAAAGWYVDPARTVLAVYTQGETYAVSSGWVYEPDGRTRRADWRPLRDLGGGVAVADVPYTPSLRLASAPYDDPSRERDVLGRPFRSDGAPENRLAWGFGTPDGARRQLGSTAPPDSSVFDNRLSARLADLAEVQPLTVGTGLWVLTGDLPDGRQVVVSERQLDADPSRVYALVGDDVVVDGGPVDPSSPLPVRVRLPDGQGWVVAALGAELRWRAGTGPWLDLPADTALLPDGDDLQVEVVRAGRGGGQAVLSLGDG